MNSGSRVLLCALVVVVAACSGGGGHAASKAPRTRPLEVRAGSTQVESAGTASTFPGATRDQIVALVRTYVDSATIQPIRTGKVPVGAATIFTGVAAAHALGPDRAVLTDDGVPRAKSDPETVVTPVALTGLADTGGNLVLVAASTSVDVHTSTRAGGLDVGRLATFVLVPDSGVWKIEGYDVAVVRKGAASGSGTAER